MGMFKKKNKLRPSSASYNDEDEEQSSSSASSGYPGYPAYQQNIPRSPNGSSVASGGTMNTKTKKKKKKGLGSKLKGLVRGKSPKTEDGSVGSNPTDYDSYYDNINNNNDNNPYNPPPPAPPPPGGRPSPQLDPRILAQIEDASSSSSYSGSDSDDDSSSGSTSSSGDEFHQELKPVEEVDEEDYDDSDNEEGTTTSSRLKTAGNNFVHSVARRIPRLGPESDDDSTFPILGSGNQMMMMGKDFLAESFNNSPVTLVILLLDPKSLRFELLQLELNDPGGLKVKDVLGRLEESVTEPALRPLDFVALVDRAGGVHKPDSDLTAAMAHRRDIHKDILVGLSKEIRLEELFRRVRPILGDANVGRMLDMNGFDTAGWAKKKNKESTLEKKVKPEPVAKGNKLRLVAMIFLGLMVLITVGAGLTYYLGCREGGIAQSAAIQLQEAVQEAVQEVTQAVVPKDTASAALVETVQETVVLAEVTSVEEVLPPVEEVLSVEEVVQEVAHAVVFNATVQDVVEEAFQDFAHGVFVPKGAIREAVQDIVQEVAARIVVIQREAVKEIIPNKTLHESFANASATFFANAMVSNATKKK